ncbi:MerR family transcriptional regulator [Anaerolentibacter hominis]|uniref:MerR family transcriptional regulator n=1 Tax=Anaerolentibacter hominis TaxID=3079009 RepID=UPI0031B80961
MKTISQVAGITGISVRTLQYYDEINLLKPSGFTPSGYRLYDEAALQKLQQILFFKELDFTLKDIKEILEKPEFDRTATFRKQKTLLSLKRARIDKLIDLLDRLEKGESCMSFKEFDLSEYIEALEQFKASNTDVILKNWGSMDNFELFIQKVKEDESNVARLAIEQYGSIEKYTEAMKYNLEHFSEIMEKQLSGKAGEIVEKNKELYSRLTANMERDYSSGEVQDIVREIVAFIKENAATASLDGDYWDALIGAYSSDYIKAVTDTQYGEGAADYIANAFRYYCHRT